MRPLGPLTPETRLTLLTSSGELIDAPTEYYVVGLLHALDDVALRKVLEKVQRLLEGSETLLIKPPGQVISVPGVQSQQMMGKP